MMGGGKVYVGQTPTTLAHSKSERTRTYTRTLAHTRTRQDSPLVLAVANGRVLVVDEADKAPPHVTGRLRKTVSFPWFNCTLLLGLFARLSQIG